MLDLVGPSAVLEVVSIPAECIHHATHEYFEDVMISVIVLTLLRYATDKP